MEKGIYSGITLENYFDIDAINQSGLTHFERSPAHYRQSLIEQKETEALNLGGILHSLVLEPNTFSNRYAILPECDRRTKDGKALYADFLIDCTNTNRQMIKSKDHELAVKMAAAVRSHVDSKKLLDKASAIEQTAIWEYRDSAETPPVLCKGRADILIDHSSSGAMIDIKSTINASELEFTRTIYNYRYHCQAPWYQDGFALNGKHYPHYCIIAVEKEEPFAVNVFRLDELSIQEGRRRNAELIEQYANCKLGNYWPAYPEGIKDISIPAWAFKREVEL